MVSCAGIVCEAMPQILEKCGKNALRSGASVRNCLEKLGIAIPDECTLRDLDPENIACEAREEDLVPVFIPMAIPADRFSGTTYVPFTLAEAMFISAFEDDPVNAHEKIYEILEPILVSEDPSLLKVKRSIFTPLHKEIYHELFEHYILFLKSLSDDKRRDACRYIEKSFKLFLSPLVLSKDGKIKEIKVKRELFKLCPNIPIS